MENSKRRNSLIGFSIDKSKGKSVEVRR